MGFIIATVGLLLALVFASEMSYRVGRLRRSSRFDREVSSQLSTIQAATMGLLALLLGFTMSMAESRFDGRRHINIDEANAVSTAYLRTAFLPEPQRSESKQLFRQYVDARRAFYRSNGENRQENDAQTRDLQAQIWERAAIGANQHPDWDVLATYIESVNTTFDLEASRALANRARLPGEILWVVVLIAIATVSITGFVSGYGGGRTLITLYALPALIAISCAVIVDLDRSWFGFIITGDLPMERVQQRMHAEAPTPPTAATR